MATSADERTDNESYKFGGTQPDKIFVKTGITGTDYDSNGSGIDASTHALTGIDYEHHEIHSGSHFYVSGFNTLATDATTIVGLTTPNTTKEIHLIFMVNATSQTEIAIYEGCEITGGIASTPFNNNRNSENASVITSVINPTVTTPGTLIESQSGGKAGDKPNAANLNGIATRSREIILKQNTCYTVQITSRDDDNIVSFLSEWYEHTPKN